LAAAKAKTLLKAAAGHRLCALRLLLISTGLRRGEVLALTWADIDLAGGQLRLRRDLQRIKRELISGTPKTTRSVRTVSSPSGGSPHSPPTGRPSGTARSR
jgi:integrase